MLPWLHSFLPETKRRSGKEVDVGPKDLDTPLVMAFDSDGPIRKTIVTNPSLSQPFFSILVRLITGRYGNGNLSLLFCGSLVLLVLGHYGSRHRVRW